MAEFTGAQLPRAGGDPDSEVTDSFELPSAPDAFGRLWTPHRMAYVKGGQGQFRNREDCPFCAAPARSDEEALIVHRGRTCYAVLNLFPYNPGHLLVCPYRHVADYTDITPEETAEMSEITQAAMRVIRKVAGPHGFNIGINQGDAGGAGIAAHLHQHVVPRWGGDGNFLPIIAQTKQITQTLDETRGLLAEAWHRAGVEDDGDAALARDGGKAAGAQ
ncbi:HIT domain-containing protein [Sinomonas sp. ASV322]|uniref:HIT family protein n=1 Tax=Sinomonas sp. ASV322 TaxID=3041920 RepID=UPI0027DAF018|nr:HIT domain-containing protein [Sinomonas sp. ASV322]MDQ4501168.1 HIT domain-containing protein [Sinomonas sp. ASV322]